MTTMRWLLTSTLLALAATRGADGQKADPAKDDKQTETTKGVKKSAAALDFQKQLGVSYPSLGTLGTRIDAARRAHDPVALAHAASELKTAEQIGNKKASLTSQELIKESAQLASLRRQVQEMQAVLKVSNQVADEEGLAAMLNKQIDDANKFTAEEKRAIQANEEPTDQPRRLLVNNYTTQFVDVYVNGNYKIQLQPGQSRWTVIEHKWNPTILTAYGNEDMTSWGPKYVWGAFKTYTWNIK